LRFVAYQDRKKVAAELKPIYTAPNEVVARKALVEFESSELGQKHPSVAMTWTNSWERFIPFLESPPMLRRVIYTTNSIESLNFQLRKATKNRGHFPSTEAAAKLLWLAICNIEKMCRGACSGPGQARRPAEGPGPTRRRPGPNELEASSSPSRSRLSQPNQPLPVTTLLTQTN